MKIYIAAPLFSPAEREFNDQLCATIEGVCDAYLPQRDGKLMEFSDQDNRQAIEATRHRVYREDIEAIHQCDGLLAVLEGRALDEGVCIEMGYAKGLGKSIFGYKSDVRIALPWGQNPIVSGCVDIWVDSLNSLRTTLAEYIAQQGVSRVCGQ